jgi:general secretion pathway protein G
VKKNLSFYSVFRFKKGFTLIELLVVISIIGILSSFLLSNFIGARQRARDGLRKSDLRQIQSALELYRSDQGSYPTELPGCDASFTDGATTSPVIYMKKIPCDPLNKTVVYTYAPSGNPPSMYSLGACLENSNDSEVEKDSSGNSTHGSCGTLWQYTIQNP